MVKKIGILKGQVICLSCYSLVEWDSIDDVKVSNGNKYITCPECGKSISLVAGKDYWQEAESSAAE